MQRAVGLQKRKGDADKTVFLFRETTKGRGDANDSEKVQLNI